MTAETGFAPVRLKLLCGRDLSRGNPASATLREVAVPCLYPRKRWPVPSIINSETKCMTSLPLARILPRDHTLVFVFDMRSIVAEFCGIAGI
jgi:hypothetical protein